MQQMQQTSEIINTHAINNGGINLFAVNFSLVYTPVVMALLVQDSA
jgi:hypothetical protein